MDCNEESCLFDSILIIRMQKDEARLIDFDGNDLNINWQVETDVSAYGYCSFVYQNENYIIGQVTQFFHQLVCKSVNC